MKILIVGGTGTIGQAVVDELEPRHEMIIAGHSHGDIKVDMTDAQSIAAMFARTGHIDALIVTTGQVKFAKLAEMSAETYQFGLQHKLMGQVNLALAAINHLHDHGSITLTSGVLNHDPISMGSSASMVNGGIDGFVKAAAIEMPRGIRINSVSPTVVAESMDKYADFFRGFEPVAASRVALAYSKSVEGLLTGQVFKAGY